MAKPKKPKIKVKPQKKPKPVKPSYDSVSGVGLPGVPKGKPDPKPSNALGNIGSSFADLANSVVTGGKILPTDSDKGGFASTVSKLKPGKVHGPPAPKGKAGSKTGSKAPSPGGSTGGSRPAYNAGSSGGFSGGSGGGSSAPAALTPAQKKQIRLEKKYGKSTKSTKTTPTKKPVDEIAQQIAAMLQGSQQLTDYYNTQVAGIQNGTVENAQKLQAQTAALMSNTPLSAATPGQMTTDQYSSALFGSAATDANTGLATSANNTGGTAQALNAYYGGQRDVANQMHKQYGISLKQQEPAMRAAKAAAEQEAAMKQAEQQYLYDKLGVDSQYKSGQLALGQARLGETIRNNTLISSDKAAGRALSLAEKNAANALKGATLSAKQRKDLNDWVSKNLYASQTNTQKDANGNSVATKDSVKKPMPYTQVYAELMASGMAPSNDAAIRIAMNHNPQSVKADTAAGFFKRLVQDFGVSERQSLKYVQQMFGQAAAKFLKQRKNRDKALSTPTPGEAANLIGDALGKGNV